MEKVLNSKMTNRLKPIKNIIRRNEVADYYQTKFSREKEIILPHPRIVKFEQKWEGKMFYRR